MNKTTLISSIAFFLITFFSFSQNEQFEYKSRPSEFENFEYRNDSIFPLKSVVTTNKILAFDIAVTSVSISTRTIIVDPTSIPVRLTTGDWVCFPETSPYPNLPTELHPVLAQRAAVYILEAMGDAENLGAARGKLAQMEKSVQKILDDRVEGAPRKVKNRHGFLSKNSTVSGRKRGNF